ncbi:MAG: hypothetical protein ACTSUE_02130 [Promethearchaeota archaeon]
MYIVYFFWNVVEYAEIYHVYRDVVPITTTAGLTPINTTTAGVTAFNDTVPGNGLDCNITGSWLERHSVTTRWLTR